MQENKLKKWQNLLLGQFISKHTDSKELVYFERSKNYKKSLDRKMNEKGLLTLNIARTHMLKYY